MKTTNETSLKGWFKRGINYFVKMQEVNFWNSLQKNNSKFRTD